MTLEDLGYNEDLEKHSIEQGLDNFDVGRVISEHKERYTVKTPEAEYDAELIGNLRFTAEDRHDFPAVGDWVAISPYDEGKALIHAIYPRTSVIERKAVGRSGKVQIIATNIDYGLIVQAVDRDFNLNRLERYLTICNASNVSPIIVLSKTDLISENELKQLISQVEQRVKGVSIITVNNQQSNGYDDIQAVIKQGKTYCLLGSSGVGKSTLLNGISGKELMETGAISSSVNKGKHTTSHRELIVMDNGGIIIDNPGMREVGIADLGSGLEMTFDTITEYAEHCRFKDCTHQHEEGCAVLEALEDGELDEDAYNNYMKMQREKAHFGASVVEKRKKDKQLGKLYKNVQNFKKKNR